MDLTPCGWCGCDTIAQYDWRDAPAAVRRQWRDDGLRQYKARGLCGACYQRGKREGFPSDEEVAEAVAANARRVIRPQERKAASRAKATERETKSPILPNPCRECGHTLVRGYAWQNARAEQRREWTYLGYRRARVGDICRLCDDARARAERDAKQAALAARILQMRSDGMRVVDIAAALDISESTVSRLAPAELVSRPNESPAVLVGGQWVTCPRRRIQVWREAS